LLFLSPLFALIAIAIKRDSPGPVFYGGPRIGLRKKRFKIWKFRTMYANVQSNEGARITAHDDARITPIGHWLRNTKLNELPQFWNVLIGEMSLVGPRPEDPVFARDWPHEVRNEILSVRPGITSPASVLYRNEEKLLSEGTAAQRYIKDFIPDKIRLDQIYVRHHDFWLDLDTLFWTFLLLLPGIGTHNPPEKLLFVGPVTRIVRRHLNWFTIDALITLAALGFSGILWRFSGPLNLGWPRSIGFGIAFSLLYSLVGALLGVNRIAWSKANFSDAFDIVPAWLLATVTAFMTNASAKRLPDGLIVMASILALIGFILARYRIRLLTVIFLRVSQALPGIKTAGERVLIVGSSAAAQHAAWLLEHPENANRFTVVGFVDNDIFKLGTRIYSLPLLGTCKEIPTLIKKHDIGLVVVADHQKIGNDYHVISGACNNVSVRYVVLPNLLEAFHHLPDLPLGVPLTGGPPDPCQVADQADRVQDKDLPCLHCLARCSGAHQALNAPEKTQ
jgi:lipopolysaccharide/colanic/teichoic acid biosynthesis glycosyltransferase